MEPQRELIRIEGVTKRFGHIVAVDEVNATIRENEFFALLGPSGCGKTTLMRLLAGFETPDAGRLLLDGRDLVGVRPYRRPLNMMFQSYALFPHMTVFDNIAYGLRQEGAGRGEIERRVADALALVQLTGFGRRRPHQLSGGERPRVALARALVKRPKVLLLVVPAAGPPVGAAPPEDFRGPPNWVLGASFRGEQNLFPGRPIRGGDTATLVGERA